MITFDLKHRRVDKARSRLAAWIDLPIAIASREVPRNGPACGVGAGTETTPQA
ncbi:hypothetical protein [Bradyrhizobium arachidis]|uniref:hypothetical protein n=1 Tax=Bradyrhizobium arachidis TaxID=858423 RepID=UPI002163961E|nr:hypothetical protein [Bradyrhizobium arachidis]UVO27037.1 hypothetical protein KUF59_31565 [Bradyrhizobium arachidis]